MGKLDKSSFLTMAEGIENLYGGFLHTFIAEATTWYEMFKTDEESDAVLNESLVEYANLIAQATPFHAAVCEAIKIGLTIQTTTCSIKLTFSRLRYDVSRRGIGQAKQPMHVAQCSQEKSRGATEFIDKVINKFGQQPRRLKFLFKQ